MTAKGTKMKLVINLTLNPYCFEESFSWWFCFYMIIWKNSLSRNGLNHSLFQNKTTLHYYITVCTLLSEWRALPLEAIIGTTYIFFFFPLRCQFNRFWQWKFSVQIKTWSHATVSTYSSISYKQRLSTELCSVTPLVLCSEEVSWCQSRTKCLNLEHSF